MTTAGEKLCHHRRQGYAIQDQEVAHGLRSIACPIRGKDGTMVAVANIAVQATQYTTTEMVRRFRSPLRETCDEVTRRLSPVNPVGECCRLCGEGEAGEVRAMALKTCSKRVWAVPR